jgi:hypothetical protein
MRDTDVYYIISHSPSPSSAYSLALAAHEEHVFIRAFLYRTSIYRVVTSSLLFLCSARISEAQNSLGHEKEVACNSFGRIQARQQSSTRYPCRLVTIYFSFYHFTGTLWSFPLERFQATWKKESFVIDGVFIPISDGQT